MEDIELSIIVPAYNEATRIPKFLGNLLEFARKNLESYEIIIVNDGSKDRTKEIVLNLIQGDKRAKLISYADNMGKGHAVLQGVLKAKGKFILFIDADGSIKPQEILNLHGFYQKYNYDIVVGSRISALSKITDPQPLSRRLLSKIFNLYSNILFQIKINDLLCGFKGFTHDVALQIFKNLKAYRWEFDVELLYKARKNGIKVYQLPIEWKHEEGSKMKIYDPIFIFLNLLKLRLRYL